jgi:hypothetical protein
MFTALQVIFFIAVWFSIPAICTWAVIDGFRKGVVRATGGSYSRVDSPRSFWIVIAMYCGVVLCSAYLTALIGIDAWHNP